LGTTIIEGKIGDCRVELHQDWVRDYFGGLVNGLSLNGADAKRLFLKYWPIAQIQDPNYLAEIIKIKLGRELASKIAAKL